MQQAGGGFESQLRVAESVMRQSQDSVSHHLGLEQPLAQILLPLPINRWLDYAQGRSAGAETPE